MNTIFEELLSEEFDSKYFLVEMTDSLYSKLSHDELVIKLHNFLESGIVTWNELREVVDKIAGTIEPGFSLNNQIALCAIAVAIEKLPSQFTGEFLDTLSRSRAPEIGKVSRIARKCIEYFKEIQDS
jgi:hypothetical protein